MGSGKYDERAYPVAPADSERATRKILAVVERLAREGQDDIIAACWASLRIPGVQALDVIAEMIQHLSRGRLGALADLARYLERSGVPSLLVLGGAAAVDTADAEVWRLRKALLEGVCRECLARPPGEDCWTRATTRRSEWRMCNEARQALPASLLAQAAAIEGEHQRRRRAAEARAAEESVKRNRDRDKGEG